MAAPGPAARGGTGGAGGRGWGRGARAAAGPGGGDLPRLHFVGGIDRIVIAKRDTDRDLCFNVVLDSPGTAPPRDSRCHPDSGSSMRRRGPPPLSDAIVVLDAAREPGDRQRRPRVSGGGVAGIPSHVNIDVTLAFPANDAGAPASETLAAQNVDVQTVVVREAARRFWVRSDAAVAKLDRARRVRVSA